MHTKFKRICQLFFSGKICFISSKSCGISSLCLISYFLQVRHCRSTHETKDLTKVRKYVTAVKTRQRDNSRKLNFDQVIQTESKNEIDDKKLAPGVAVVKIQDNLHMEGQIVQEQVNKKEVEDGIEIVEKESAPQHILCNDESPELTSSKILEMEKQISAKLALLPAPDQRKSLETLDGCQWIDDQVINMYLELITERSVKNQADLPKVYAINTSVFPRFRDLGYQRVKNCIPNQIDIFSYDLVFIPIHTPKHWSLVVADFKRQGIFYYNSMKKGGMDILFWIIYFLKFEHLAKKNKEFQFSDFKVESMTDIPKQENGFDCGMYLMKYADFLSRNVPLTFTQEKMEYYRKCTKVELFLKELMEVS